MLKRAGSTVRNWAEVIANLTVIAALPLALLSYCQQSNVTRETFSIEMTTKLSEEPLIESHRRFLSEMTRLPLEKLSGRAIPRETMGDLIEQMVDTSQRPQELLLDVIGLVNYYDELQSCIDTKTCSEKIVLARSKDRAERFSCIVIPYIKKIRKKMLLDGLGEGLIRLSNYERSC